jgi:AcrR family transcriptional regulator
MLREKILRSAISLFAEKRFDQVLIDDVAARAGVGKGSIYRQFSSKEELYTAMVIEGYVDLRTRITVELDNKKSTAASVTTIVRQIVAYFWNRLEFFELLRDPARLPRAYEKRYRSERQKLVEMLSQIIAQGAKDGVLYSDLDPRLLVECLFGMIRGIQRYRRGAPSLSQQEVVNTVVRVFLGGCSLRSPAA